MSRIRRTLTFAAIVSINLAAWLAIERFDVPAHWVFLVLLILAYVKHEQMFEQISMDLRMVESAIEEKYPEEVGGYPNLRRKF